MPKTKKEQEQKDKDKKSEGRSKKARKWLVPSGTGTVGFSKSSEVVIQKDGTVIWRTGSARGT